MIKKEVLEFFENRHDDQGIPKVPAAEWEQLIATYEKDDIRESLAEYIHSNKIGFPIKNIEDTKLKQLFKEFCSRSLLDQVKHFDVVEERYPYLHKYSDRPLGVIDKSHFFNPVSDYFQQENRMKCGSNTSPAPLEIWNDQAKLAKMNWTFWRKGIIGDDDLTAKTFRSAFRLGTYTATQFKPSVAKVLYEKHGAKNVLDTSCGWGDRLAGFYATPSTELYVGCDPNPDVFEVYKKQCVFYEKELGCTPIVVTQPNYFECHGKKTVKIWNLPSEDVDWTLYPETFDLYFTSPPYFETEKYAMDTDKAENQSWARYDSFEGWKYNFFFKVTEMVWPTIRKDGYMMINIIEPRSKRNARLPLCDDMVEHFSSLPDSNYIGKIGMRMMARPNTSELKGVFIEPIWVFRKGNNEYVGQQKEGLEAFFG